MVKPLWRHPGQGGVGGKHAANLEDLQVDGDARGEGELGDPIHTAWRQRQDLAGDRAGMLAVGVGSASLSLRRPSWT